MADKQQKTLSAAVSESTYFKFKDISNRYGETVSDTLRRLIHDFISDFDYKVEQLINGAIVDEIEGKNNGSSIPATDRQMNYLGLLWRRTGEKSLKNLNIEEANLEIRRLLQILGELDD